VCANVTRGAGSVEPGRQPLPKEITQPLSGSIQNRIYDRYFGYGWSDSMNIATDHYGPEGQNGRRYLDCDIRVRIARGELAKVVAGGSLGTKDSDDCPEQRARWPQSPARGRGLSCGGRFGLGWTDALVVVATIPPLVIR